MSDCNFVNWLDSRGNTRADWSIGVFLRNSKIVKRLRKARMVIACFLGFFRIGFRSRSSTFRNMQQQLREISRLLCAWKGQDLFSVSLWWIVVLLPDIYLPCRLNWKCFSAIIPYLFRVTLFDLEKRYKTTVKLLRNHFFTIISTNQPNGCGCFRDVSVQLLRDKNGWAWIFDYFDWKAFTIKYMNWFNSGFRA